MIRAVIDTNVLVSGTRNPHGNEARLLLTVRAGLVRPCFSDAILAEWREVLFRPRFAFPVEDIAKLLALLERNGELFHPGALPVTGPDPDDFMFIRCALAARAEYLVTGNKRHFPDPFYGAARVVNARELIDRLSLPP